MGSGSRDLTNIVKVQKFEAQPDQEVEIGLSDTILLMPIWRLCGDRYIDATGDYDLCMSLDGLKMTFISRRPLPEVFAYRFFPANWLASRLGRPFA